MKEIKQFTFTKLNLSKQLSSTTNLSGVLFLRIKKESMTTLNAVISFLEVQNKSKVTSLNGVNKNSSLL